jgi:hypothetical protein
MLPGLGSGLIGRAYFAIEHAGGFLKLHGKRRWQPKVGENDFEFTNRRSESCAESRLRALRFYRF